MKQKAIYFFKKCDLLGYYPQLYAEQGTTYNTGLGGFISVFIWIGIFYGLINYTLDTLWTRTPTIMNYETVRNDVPIFDYTASGSMDFMILFMNADLQPIIVDRTIIELRYYTYHYFVDPIRKNRVENNLVNEFDFSSCSNETITKLKDLFNPVVADVFTYLNCPKYNYTEKQKIGGSIIYNTEQYIPSIGIGPKCSNRDNCTTSEKAQFTKYIAEVVPNAIIGINYFIPNPKDIKNPKKNVFSGTQVSLANNADYKIKFSEVFFSTDDNFVPLIGGLTNDKFFTLDSIIPSTMQSPEIGTGFLIDISDHVNNFERKYPKVDSILTRFFSFYFSLLFLGTVLRGFLHTYNLERFLINSTIVNETSVKVKIEGASKSPQPKKKSKKKSESENSPSVYFKDNEQISDLNIKLDYSENISVKPPSKHKVSDSNNDLRVKLVPKEDGKEQDISTINNTFKRELGQNEQNNITHFSKAPSNLSDNTNIAIISQEDTKLNRLKNLYKTVKDYKVKVGLRDRYSFSSLPETFQKHVRYLYTILDARNMIKMCLQFEKMKQIVFNEKQKLIFELFSVDIGFVDAPMYNKNIEEMDEEQVKSVIDCLENVNEDTDEVSKHLIKLLPEEFKKIMFD